ncbi:protein Wiz isoform X2 [Sorex fumeus]|uniref:protein Wiz isoform X2 n=1 Tax=Sorex fumeus TaxID=62283 RepID=UPI0024AD790C|nr:protein Wiz isoform X2 [Sorex fumeus]
MDGPLAGGLVAPDHPCGPSRLPGPAPREDMDGGIEEAEGDSSIFQTTQYLPLSKEGPRDILDGQGSLSDGQPHPSLCEALPRASSASLRTRPCLDLRPGSPLRRLWGRFPGPPDGQGPWENTVHPEVGEGRPLEHRVEDLVIVRPGKELEGGALRLSHIQSNLTPVHKGFRGRPQLHWHPDREGPLHPDLLPPPLCPSLPSPSFQPVLLPPAVNNDAQTLAMTMVEAPQNLEGLEGQAEWGLSRAASEVATQTWTVNAEASVERLPPRHPEPYLCGLLEEVAEGAADLEEEDDDDDDDEDEDKEPAVFPCLECSIYFPHKAHLLEHMSQHRRAPGQEPPAHLTPLSCGECGWAFADPQTLQQHRRLHQASREKILEEIQKLKQVPAGEGWGTGLPGPHCALDDRPGEPLAATAVLACPPPGASSSSSSGLQACWYCGFLASSETLLREHVRLAHAAPPWDGPSQEVHDCIPPAVDYFGQVKPFLGPDWQEGPAGHSPSMELGRGCPPLGWTGPQLPRLTRASASCSVQLQQDVPPDPLGAGSYPWSDEEEEGIPLTPEVDAPPGAGLWLSPSTPGRIPPRALELRRTFWEALRAAEASTLQQRQLRWTVPVVLLPRVGPEVLATTMAARQGAPEALRLTGAHPLDLLLLDTPLGLDALLGGDPMAALRPEERRCPYCPDRFHNGIGLANHVRGHLNRVGVSYNVRHFISAEEVKAIERSCSFQKKKKKVANFDPGTFSLMRCDFCGAGFDTRAGLSSHARAHLRDFGITNWELTVSPISVLQELLATAATPRPPGTLLPARRARMPLPLPCPSGWAEDLGPTYSDAHSLTTCEVCGACFETRKGLSSHARSHLRQLGVAESESSGAPIDLLYELVRQKGLPDAHLGLPPSLAKKSGSPKEMVAGAPRPGLLTLAKPLDAPAINKAIKSPPGFSAKGMVHPPSSPLLKKAPLALAGSPNPRNPEDKSPQLSLSPRPGSPKAPWPQSEDEGPLNLTVDSARDRGLNCPLCGAWFETRRGLSSHARAHLRHLGASDPDAKRSPILLLHGLVRRAGSPSPLGCPLTCTASLLPVPTLAQKAEQTGVGVASPPGKQRLLAATTAAGICWASDVERLPLALSSGPEPARDIRCEFCGEFFENRKGLSSHARSHLRQMGVTEWYVNGSPIDTLREILKRRTQSRPGGAHPPGHSPKALAKMAGSGSPGGVLEARSPADLHLSPLAKKLPPPPGSPLGHSPTASPPPTARKMFPGLAAPSLSRKLKPEQMRVEIKREALLHGEPHPPDSPWAAPREDLSPLNLSSRAEPVRDIRCEFCGEFFENRKGLSSHARSHLRQMGVTEWSVNGSPIDTLREILKKKTKPCLIKKEPPAGDLAPALVEDGPHLVAPGPMQSALPLVPMAGRPGKPGAGLGHIPRELILAPLSGTKAATVGYLGSMAAKRPLQEDRLLPPEVKAKTYIQTELPFKAKALHDKASHSSTEACCELCGLYFENRKALASHARAHLRQFGVTEWCVNGSPIETLSEWIKHRPQKVGAYRSYIQGGRPFTKKFRSAGHSREGDKRPPLGLAPGGLALVGRSACGEPGLDLGRAADGSERPLASSPPGTVKAEEHQRQNINKFERRQARPADASGARGSEDAGSLQQKLEEVRQPPPRVRPVPSLVPRPPQTSLVKFVGNIYTLKCRFCEAQFQGPLSIQEEWVRHLQRHILDMSFSKVDAPPEEPPAPQAQTAVTEAP